MHTDTQMRIYTCVNIRFTLAGHTRRMSNGSLVFMPTGAISKNINTFRKLKISISSTFLHTLSQFPVRSEEA